MKAVTVTPFGEPTHGVWCPTCALPSGFTLPVILTDTTARATLCTGTYSGCLDCGQPIPTR